MSSSTTTASPYEILSTVHVNQWQEDQQAVVGGWLVKARWIATGAVVPVFVPDTADLVSTADLYIRHVGQQLDSLAAKSR